MPSTTDDDIDLVAIGTFCRLARKNAGRDQTDVAAVVGTHQATLSRIERGLETNVPARLLDGIARQFGYALVLVPLTDAAAMQPATGLGVAS